MVLALVGSREIFSKALFAWTAVGMAFGPVLAVRLWWDLIDQRSNPAAILAGFITSVTAFSVPGWKGTWLERVFPCLLGLIIA